MTEAEALASLRVATAADQDPVLEEDELLALLQRFRVEDADGYGPGDADWTPTWQLSAAAGHGWRQKAGKAAGRYDLNTDGQSLARGAVMSHCLRMANEYLRGAAVAVRIPGSTGATAAEMETN
jgi:hypothetical protein